MSTLTLHNWIDGAPHPPLAGSDAKYINVTTPYTGATISRVPLSSSADVNAAVAAAKKAFGPWSSRTVKDRVAILFKFHSLLIEHASEIADLVVAEHGKNNLEALQSLAKGNETVEYAISLPQLIQGRILEVSRGVVCHDVREPLGVVASVVPFNFPVMVPMWTLPIAICTGNCMVLKPSEKVPMTMTRIVELLKEAGLPDGVVNLVHGTADAVNALIEHSDVKAVTFVGTTRVAELVYKRCRNLNKKALCLGGAKNHLVSAPDCDVEMTAQDVVNSFTGCAGERCMAASVLLTIGSQKRLLDSIVDIAQKISFGSEKGQLGPVIDAASRDKITQYVADAESGGARILLDGRNWSTGKLAENQGGFWIGPTVILHKSKADKALHEEIFGPVLSVYECSSKEEAIEIENGNPYGNAACIYTKDGATAEWFSKRFSAGMIGVNIGVPVPREPFSFGGWNASKFGDGDITGDGGIEFFTKRRKITTKWNPPQDKSWMS